MAHHEYMSGKQKNQSVDGAQDRADSEAVAEANDALERAQKADEPLRKTDEAFFKKIPGTKWREERAGGTQTFSEVDQDGKRRETHVVKPTGSE